MIHNDVRNELLKSPEVKKEYDNLKLLYDIKREIIKLRVEQGLSQKDLADKIQTQQSAISRLESGEYNPSVELLAKVANALGKELHITFQ